MQPGAALAFLAATAAFAQVPAKLVRLPPSAFPGLPANLVAELQHRGCRVPQTDYTSKPHNVIRGEFAKPGQTDWAVLCSVGGTSRILVFWNGSEKNPAAIAPLQDSIFLQGAGNGKLYFSRSISAVGKDFIMRHYRGYGGPKPPPLHHQGIDDAFLEKASVTWYHYGGRWLKLTGAD